MVKLCIFDMDGTTVNTINSIAYFANNALNKYGLSSIDTEKYKIIVGNGAKVLVERMIELTGGTKEQFEKVLVEYNTTYDNDFMYLTEAYEGIIVMLKTLKEMGVESIILSNKPHQTALKVSNELFGDDLIKRCFGGREGIPLKPDPQAVYEILELEGVKKEECIYIGDTSTDMKTGKGAGLYTVGVLWGFRGREELESSGADVIISNPRELIDIVKSR